MRGDALDLTIITLFLLWVALGLANGIHLVYDFLHTHFKRLK